MFDTYTLYTNTNNIHKFFICTQTIEIYFTDNGIPRFDLIKIVIKFSE